MKKILLFIGISMMAALAGCADKEDIAEEPVDAVVSGDEAGSDISENEISDSDVSGNEEDENDLSENEIAENDAEEEEQVTVYYLIQDNVDGVEDALFHFGEKAVRLDIQPDITFIEEYVEEVPVPLELQERFLHSCTENMDDVGEYKVELQVVTEEMAEMVPEGVLGHQRFQDDYWIDFDGDGENEYFHYEPNGKGHGIMCIHKNIDGRWETEKLWWGNILYYEGQYYIDAGVCLYWLKDEYEYYGNINDRVGDVGDWGQLWLRWTETGYTPYEVYSNTQDDHINYLENINWETLTDDDSEKAMIGDNYFPTSWYVWRNDVDHDTYVTHIGLEDDCWERYYEGEHYLYVAFREYFPRNSYWGLMILRQTGDETWEIAKVYYLSKGYCYYIDQADT